MLNETGPTKQEPYSQLALVEILRCPVTHAPLRGLSIEEVSTINKRIEDGALYGMGGDLIVHPVEAAVASSDGRYVYRIENEVYLLLPDLAIDTARDTPASSTGAGLSVTKSSVQTFYDSVGWDHEYDVFTDAALFEDLRTVSEDYRTHCNRRVNRHLPDRGRYLVDAASGPIQYQDYLDFSKGFEVRVCIDFSIRALRDVKDKLGDAALCIMADVTNLPIRDSSVDAAISLHTIYHVPDHEQHLAFKEVHRILQPGGSGVVVYSWGASFPVRLVQAPLTIRKKARTGFRSLMPLARRSFKTHEQPLDTPLYFAPYGYRWFVAQQWPFKYEILSWRSVSVPVLRAYFPDTPLGRRGLKWLASLEDRLPRMCGRWGQYPLIVLQKAK